MYLKFWFQKDHPTFYFQISSIHDSIWVCLSFSDILSIEYISFSLNHADGEARKLQGENLKLFLEIAFLTYKVRIAYFLLVMHYF